ncbi:hypothetical protein PIROE2DRAFT_11806 [Piromyces sp. E2]|nr:hypothetical protein PIROE2DRAFT_11806 [Piromyces sp. E2]|eukprot:OUM62042.1 hypothetical protein PIROE2DRAFT_11806 [Piromyces sp. E2]
MIFMNDKSKNSVRWAEAIAEEFNFEWDQEPINSVVFPTKRSLKKNKINKNNYTNDYFSTNLSNEINSAVSNKIFNI